LTPPVDHLVYACPELADGVRRLEALLGVEASPGGQHEGRGTRNALIGLGPDAYLEIIGPDPARPDPAHPRWFGLDGLDEPRLVTWCARSDDLHASVAAAHEVGIDIGSVAEGSRRRPDGATLSWAFTDPRAQRLDGLVPFYIDWSGSRHPAEDLTHPCSLLGLSGRHPDAEGASALLAALGIDLPVRQARVPGLVASIRTPSGVVELA